MIKEVPEGVGIPTAEFVFSYAGPSGMRHNYLCAVCRTKHAVINAGNGVLQPCWDCQKEGYEVIKFSKRGFGFNWIDKVLGREKLI